MLDFLIAAKLALAEIMGERSYGAEAEQFFVDFNRRLDEMIKATLPPKPGSTQ